MGSCLSTSDFRTATQEEKEELVKQTESCPGPEPEPVKVLQADGAYKKKMVRFKLQEDDDNVGRGSTEDGDSRSGVVRIRVVMTLKELKQILNKSEENFQYSSVKELVSAMKLTRRTCKLAKTSCDHGDHSWRPALESIPEDH